MENFKLLKNQIKAISKTKQITKAMHTISASKIKKSEIMLSNFLVFEKEFNTVFNNIILKNNQKKELSEAKLIILLTSDRGLCGSYHSQLFKYLNNFDQNSYLYIIGRKGFFYYKNKNNFKLLNNFPISNHDDTETVDLISLSKILKKLYYEKNLSKISIIYQKNIQKFDYKPYQEIVFPIDNNLKDDNEIESEFIFDENRNELFNDILYTYLETRIYKTLLNAKKCEHSARLLAMQNATDNCDKLINKLKLKYNHARQQAITSELIDIVNGAKGSN